MSIACAFPACGCTGQCRYAAPTRPAAPPRATGLVYVAGGQPPGCTFPACKCVGGCKPRLIAAVLARALGKPCPYCGEAMGQRGKFSAPTRDHAHLPRSRGGTLQPGNCLIVCRGCNEEKKDRSLYEFASWLRGRDDERYARIMHLLQQDEVAA